VKVLAVTLALLLGLGVGAAALGLTPAQGRSDARAVAAGRRFLDGYVEPDGRVVRWDQGGDTVSEGQSYALLVATALGDEELVDRVWSWTQRHLSGEDGLVAWHWVDGAVADRNAASDGDLVLAWALAVAGERFDRDDLRTDGERLARAVLDRLTVPTARGPVLVAGPWAVGSGTVNPSYWVLPAYRWFAPLDPRWDELAVSATGAVDELTQGGRALAPDWAVVEPTGVLRAQGGADGQGRPRHGLDAARVTVWRALACEEDQRAAAARAGSLLGPDPARARALDGGVVDPEPHPLALVAAAAAAHAQGDARRRDALLASAEAIEAREPGYYGAAWVALGRILLTTDLFPTCP
jgi:endoglucanase